MPSVQIGYSTRPGWAHQWRTVQRHLARLREQYRGIDVRGNLDMEDTVDALFLALSHLFDWLHQDSGTALQRAAVASYVRNHESTLGLSRAYANTRKHMRRRNAGDLVAQIRRIETGPLGQTATIGYWPSNQPGQKTEVDALDLAERCERDWRALLAANGIPVPSP